MLFKNSRTHSRTPTTRTNWRCWSSGAAVDWPPFIEQQLMRPSWVNQEQSFSCTQRQNDGSWSTPLSPPPTLLGFNVNFYTVSKTTFTFRGFQNYPSAQPRLKVVWFQKTFLFLSHFSLSSAPQLSGAALTEKVHSLSSERTFCWQYMHWFAF